MSETFYEGPSAPPIHIQKIIKQKSKEKKRRKNAKRLKEVANGGYRSKE